MILKILFLFLPCVCSAFTMAWNIPEKNISVKGVSVGTIKEVLMVAIDDLNPIPSGTDRKWTIDREHVVFESQSKKGSVSNDQKLDMSKKYSMVAIGENGNYFVGNPMGKGDWFGWKGKLGIVNTKLIFGENGLNPEGGGLIQGNNEWKPTYYHQDEQNQHVRMPGFGLLDWVEGHDFGWVSSGTGFEIVPEPGAISMYILSLIALLLKRGI